VSRTAGGLRLLAGPTAWCRKENGMSVNNVQGLAIAIALLVVGRALVAVLQYLFGAGQ